MISGRAARRALWARAQGKAALAQISSILVEMSLLNQKHREHMRIVGTYMKLKKLPPELRDKIHDFFDTQYKENSGVDEGEILQRLIIKLRNEIMQARSPGS